jgi:hypothetical protein
LEIITPTFLIAIIVIIIITTTIIIIIITITIIIIIISRPITKNRYTYLFRITVIKLVSPLRQLPNCRVLARYSTPWRRCTSITTPRQDTKVAVKKYPEYRGMPCKAAERRYATI